MDGEKLISSVRITPKNRPFPDLSPDLAHDRVHPHREQGPFSRSEWDCCEAARRRGPGLPELCFDRERPAPEEEAGADEERDGQAPL